MHNIHVKVAAVEGSGECPLKCSHIISIAIGSIYCSGKSLNSYQNTDLGRLHRKWNGILMDQIEYTQNEVNKIISKKDN